MEAIEHIITDDSLARVNSRELADYLCHAYCRRGWCTFSWCGRQFRLEGGQCMIVPRRGDLFSLKEQSADFEVDVIYVSQSFIEQSTPQSNYGMRGHMALFENPVMPLTPSMSEVCAMNFDSIHRRLADVSHRFRHEALVNAVQTMIIDFFDFHANIYGSDSISLQQSQLMQQFIDMLEQGDFRQNRDIGYYADRLCVTSKHLSEVSKHVSGMPANYWITRYTALDIRRQLRNRRLSLTDIADMFGFSSPSHFSHYVQKNLGAKPSDFRN